MSFYKILAFKNVVAIFLLVFYFTLTNCNSSLKKDNESLKKNFFNKNLLLHNYSIENSLKSKKVSKEILSTNNENISLKKFVDFKALEIKNETISQNQNYLKKVKIKSENVKNFNLKLKNFTFGQKEVIKNLTKNDKQQLSISENLRAFRYKRTTTKAYKLNYHDYLPSYRTTASAINQEKFSENFYSTPFKDKLTESNVIYKYSPTKKYTIKPKFSLKHINSYTSSLPFNDSQSLIMPNEKKTNQYNYYFPNKKKKKKKYDNTASSILPLLLFDEHQLAQEELNSKPFTTTPNPFVTNSISYNYYTPTIKKSLTLPSHFPKSLNSSKIQNSLKSKLKNVNFDKENILIYNEKNSPSKLSILDNTELNKNISFGNTNWLKNDFNSFSGIKIEETHVPKSKFSNENIPIKCLFCYLRSNYENLNKTKKSIKNEKKGYNFDKSDQTQIDFSQFEIDKPKNENNFYLINEYYSTTPISTKKKSLQKAEVELFTSLSSFLQVDRHHAKLGLHPIIYVNSNSSFNDTSFFDSNSTFNQNSFLSPALQNILRISLALVIIITIIGNTLVCLSPIYFRKLRHPSNYLLISLALSDLGVALLVMPIALFSELHPTWLLGDLICDIWLGLDVVCCTASILHLCVICIDRYLTITRPFTYAVERRNSRSLFLISIVWLLSAFICLPPLLVLGNEHGTVEQPICEYCNNFAYQLYATLGAFYIPLFVMLVLYYKIYVAAKKVIEAEHKSQCNSVIKSNLNSVKKSKKKSHLKKSLIEAHPTEQQYEMNSINFINKIKLLKKNATKENKNFDSKNCISCKQKLENFIVDCSIENPSSKENFKINTYTDNESYISKPPENKLLKNINKNKSFSEIENLDDSKINKEKKETKTKKNRNRTPKKLLVQKTFNTSQLLVSHEIFDSSNIINELCEKCLNELVLSCNNNNLNDKNKFSINIVNDNEINEKTIFNDCVTSNSSNKNDNLESKESLKDDKDKPKRLNNKYKSMGSNCVLQINNQNCNKKVNHSMLRERKASITLGVIMCAFIFCWLPFFILALVRPFISERIPDWASSITLWLGYMNSMLNPIIYVTFHQDFRRAFKYIIICRCKIMKSSLRKEAYNVQYG